MNEEILEPGDALTGTPDEFTTEELEAETPVADVEETEAIVMIDYTPVIQDAALTISGAQLFGAFLIVGVLLMFKIMGGNPHD